MENERVKNIKRNLIFNVIKYGVDLVFKFVLRTVMIYYLGVQYLGLNGLFSNIFTFLNLADLGIGTAIVFSMYKPVAENDIEKIKTLQNIYKKFYLIVSIIILALGGIVTPFIKSFINGESPSDINLYLLFGMYLINAVCGYLFAHKRSLLFAYQRNDIENKIKSVCTIVMSGLQVAAIVIFKNYYIYYPITIVFTIVDALSVYLVAKKYYPEISGPSNKLDDDTKREITRNITAISMHKVGGAIVFSTDNILISAFISLTVLGAYSNYALIFTTLGTLYILLNNALTSSLGNMVASCDVEYCYKRFRLVNFSYSYLTAFTTICMFVLFQPFIKMWTSNNPDYLLNVYTVMLLCISYYLTRMRTSVILFRDVTGLFWNDRWKPIVESVVNLVASLLLVKPLGLNGIILGTIISTVIAPLWVEPLVLYKHYFKKPLVKYFTRYAIDTIIMVAAGVACYFICALIPEGGIWWLLLRFGVCAVSCALFLFILNLLTPEGRSVIGYAKRLFKKKSDENTAK